MFLERLKREDFQNVPPPPFGTLLPQPRLMRFLHDFDDTVRRHGMTEPFVPNPDFGGQRIRKIHRADMLHTLMASNDYENAYDLEAQMFTDELVAIVEADPEAVFGAIRAQVLALIVEVIDAERSKARAARAAREEGTNGAAPGDPGPGEQPPPALRAVTVNATASAAKAIATHGLDIAAIKGTGIGGKITLPDVEAHIQSPSSQPSSP